MDCTCDNTIKNAIDLTISAFTEKLIKYNMLQLEPTAFDKTLVDIKNFKCILELIENDKVDQVTKEKYISFLLQMQKALKRLKDNVSDQEFILFYNYNFNNQSKRELALNIGVDEATVTRAINNCIRTLSLYLYPELTMDEIFY